MFSKGVVLVFLILGLSSSIAHAIPHQNRAGNQNPCTDSGNNSLSNSTVSKNSTTGSGKSGSKKGSDLSKTGNSTTGTTKNANTQLADVKNNTNANSNNDSDPKSSQCLSPQAIVTAAKFTGLEAAANPEPGTSPSETSTNNFINVCVGKTLTNGTQNASGSCNSIPMGDIPESTKTPSAKFVFPTNLAKIDANKNFTAKLKLKNVQLGVFTNADASYYAAPQRLNDGGVVIGHTHITVDNVGSIDSTDTTDPTRFSFFKGINDAAAADGTVTAQVNGLPAGTYRFCSLTTTANHVMSAGPVAQHGANDDCVYAIVGNGGNATTGKNTAADNNNINITTGNTNTTGNGADGKNATSGGNDKNNKGAKSGSANPKTTGKGTGGDATTGSNSTTNNGNSTTDASNSVKNTTDKTSSTDNSTASSSDKGRKDQENNGKGRSTLNKRHSFSLEYRKD